MKNVIYALFSCLILSSKLFGCSNLLPPINIAGGESPPPDIMYLMPQICVSDTGHRMAIWQRNVFDMTMPNTPPTQVLIQYSYYDPNVGSWTPVSNPPSTPAGYVDFTVSLISQLLPKLCCLPNGEAIIIWIEQGATNTVYGSNFSGGSWSTPTSLGTFMGAVDETGLGCLDSGEAVAVWTNTATTNLEYSYFNGSTWSLGAIVPGATNASKVVVCSDRTGTATAAWLEDCGGTPVVKASQFTFPGTWSAPVQISTAIAPWEAYCTIGLDIDCDEATGNVTVMWGERDGVTFLDRFVVNSFNGAWGVPQNITDPNEYAFPFDGIDPFDFLVMDMCTDINGITHILFEADSVTNFNERLILAVDYNAASNSLVSPITVIETAPKFFANAAAFSDPQVCCSPCGPVSAIFARGPFSNVGTTGPSDVKIIDYDINSGQWNVPAQTVFQTDLPVIYSAYFREAARPTLACDSFGNFYPISNNFTEMFTTSGNCSFIPSVIQYIGENRFPFQTECCTVISWGATSCLLGLERIDLYLNGVLFKQLPGSNISTGCLNGLESGDIVVIQPVSKFGIIAPSTTVVIP